MDLNIGFLASAFAAIFITINPISKVPFFLVLTEDCSKDEKKKIMFNAIKVSVPVLIFFAIAGKYLLMAFAIEFLALRLVGAIVILKIGFDMLQGQTPKTKSSLAEHDEAVEKEMRGVVPLAIPMIAGPGSMIVCMLYMANSTGIVEYGAVIGFVVLTCLITYFLLMESEKIYKRLGNVGIQTTMRVMGIIIAAIGVQMFIDGIRLFAQELALNYG